MRSLLLLACVISAGCVPYPIYKTLQPETHIRVTDQAGIAVAGASVTLLANAYPSGREQHRQTLATSESGLVVFESRREWRAEVLVLHGWQEFFWNICVVSPGYATFLTRHSSASTFAEKTTVVLQQGESQSCPAPGRR